MLPESLKRFIELFSKIPSIGPRQAQRIAFWFLRHDKNFIYSYSFALKNLADNLKVCPQCFYVFENNSNENLCEICRNPNRNNKLIAIVEKETDLITIEKTKKYNGLYHVLGGLVLPIENNLEDLRIKELINRLRNNPQTEEVILAFSHTASGDLTALELEKILKNFKVKVTKLAIGLQRGAEVEFADEDTLINALENRK